MRRFMHVRWNVLLCLTILGLLTAAIAIPFRFSAQASAKKGLFTRTESADPAFPNFDIRSDKSSNAADFIASARNSAGKSLVGVADIRKTFLRGEAELRSRSSQAKVEYNDDIKIPEVITPNVWSPQIQYLSAPSTEKHSEILRNFVKQNDSLIGVDAGQADSLTVTADYTNPDGDLSFAHLEQRINGIPVFRGEVKAGFDKEGRIIRVINDLAPGLDYGSISSDFGDPLTAVKSAAGNIDHEFKGSDLARNDAASNDLKAVFGDGDWATDAEKMYFPTEPGVAVPAWRVLIWQPVNAYYVIVDAATGTMLWRKNLSNDQLQSAVYEVYRNTAAYLDIADSPAPLSPGPNSPLLGTQGAITARSNVTLVGNEGASSFNNNGWIPDGGNTTDGNAVEAGIDRDGVNGVDAPQVGLPSRIFTSTWNPPPGNPGPGDDPLTTQAQRGAVIQMFYAMNRYHDELYKRGFTEPARNFQAFNFNRGGAEGDRISAEGQDSTGSNNAGFSTAADGVRGRMQMYIWTGPTPHYDGTADAEIMYHEATHGLSNRLHGNASGLTSNMAGGMGEGWSDWYADTLLAQPTDSVNGIYTIGGYATYQLVPGFTSNYYYGIRRFPRAPMSIVGVNGRPHDPFTFKHLNANCDDTLGTPAASVSSAFPRSPAIATIGACDEVHNAGEIWSSALWEARVRLINRLGFATGTTRVLQIVTDGMKLAPLNPTFIQERDSILAAALAQFNTGDALADSADIREGFRIRGMGYTASVQTLYPAAVTEAFDKPNVVAGNPITVSDTFGDNDGYPEPGENVTITVPVTNPNTHTTVTNVFANVNGGANVSYGNIPDAATVTRDISFTVPAGAACGSNFSVSINVSSDSGAQPPTPFTFKLGVPVIGTATTFSNPAKITINDLAPATPFPSQINVSGISGQSNLRITLNGLSHTFPADIDMLLVSPGGQKMEILSDQGSGTDIINATVSFTDSAAAPVSAQIVSGDYRPSADAGQDPFPSPAPPGPYAIPGPGGSATLGTTFGTDGASFNGTWSLYIVDDQGGDFGQVANGWALSFEASNYLCSVTGPRSRADFDGDGKTDVSVFRPSDGIWYLNRSTAGFTGVKWGVAGDIPVPGDYDGDGKADFAVWRPSDAAGTPDFYILTSSTFVFTARAHGSVGDIPVAGDFDGDGISDLAVWRPSTGAWYVFSSLTQAVTGAVFGAPGDIPMAMDREGDGKANFAVFRPSNNTWYIARATGTPAQNFEAVQWGSAGDTLVPADYDGDGKDDIAVFRPSNGVWYILRSSDGAVTFQAFGTSGDIAVPGDYDGDGRSDLAVYRSGIWYINRSSSGFTAQSFGTSTDIPILAKYHP
ncbi:MAG: M36 family metallopeptidase [Acidobacteriota bacterium]